MRGKRSQIWVFTSSPRDGDLSNVSHSQQQSVLLKKLEIHPERRGGVPDLEEALSFHTVTASVPASLP